MAAAALTGLDFVSNGAASAQAAQQHDIGDGAFSLLAYALYER